MNGIGLVLAGGGGKGAYQIGVWKYLHECGLDRYVRAVSGTSVGSLNAALFASGDFQRAEDLWLNIQPSQILSPRKVSLSEVIGWIGKVGLAAGIRGVAAGAATISMQALTAGITSMLGRRYAFSRDGLIALIQQGLDFSVIQNSQMPCYATCLAIPECSVRRFDLCQYSAEEATTLLLASSAIPLVFDSEEFRGDRYYDGGIPLVGDNVPIKPIYDLGLDCIIVVHLGQDYIIKTQNPAIPRLKRSRCRSSQEITDSPTPFSALYDCLWTKPNAHQRAQYNSISAHHKKVPSSVHFL